jgi:tRNA threonylcarbamoyladenosine biosynthesis protein TsaE
VTVPLEIITTATAQTLAAGRLLGALLRGGDVVALSGPLGAGKTHFVKGIARGIGVSADEPVVSPTFVLVREYAGDLTLYHIDAYRLGSADELRELGLDEMRTDPDGVIAIEWADRFADVLPASTCRVELAHSGPETRTLRVAWPDPRLAELRRGVENGL